MEPAFEAHFFRFLDLDEGGLAGGRRVFSSPNRALPICRHFHATAVATVFAGRLVVSVAPDHHLALVHHLEGREYAGLSEELRLDLDDAFLGRLTLPGVRRMRRYTVRPEWLDRPAAADAVRALGPDDLALFSTLMRSRGPRVREAAFAARRDVFADRRFFGVVEDDRLVAHAEVSDLVAGGGNLAVQTLATHRRRGHARALIARAAEWCHEHDVVPVYWVDEDNLPSLALAESLGFRLQSTELTVTSRS